MLGENYNFKVYFYKSDTKLISNLKLALIPQFYQNCLSHSIKTQAIVIVFPECKAGYLEKHFS